MSIFGIFFGRGRKNPTQGFECGFLAQVASIPYDDWEIVHKNPSPTEAEEAEGRWESRHPRNRVGYDPRNTDPQCYKLIFEANGHLTEFYQDPSSGKFRIRVNSEEIYYGDDNSLRDLWYSIFNFQLLNDKDKKLARATDAIAQAIKDKAEPKIPER